MRRHSLRRQTLAFLFFVYSDVPVYICNQIKFGYLLAPLDESQTIQDDYAQLTNIMLEASGNSFFFLRLNIIIDLI